jgi:hypothetical protein
VTAARGPESLIERLVAMLMLAVFVAAFACLAAGLAIWIVDHGDETAALLLVGGLLSLMLLPTLRLAAAIAEAHRQRDWLMLGSSLAVLAILFALTFRDAARFR